MKIRVLFVPLMLYILALLLGASLSLAQDNKNDIKARMKERYSELKKLKKEGKVGETKLGSVKPVTEKYAKDKNIQKIVSAENADREKLYRIIANEAKTTVKVVRENNARRIFLKTVGEEYFEDKDGKWRQKKKLKKKN